jgi:hypothetical protein
MPIIRAAAMPIANLAGPKRRKSPSISYLSIFMPFDPRTQHDAKTPHECSGAERKMLLKAQFVAVLSQNTTMLPNRNYYVRLEAFAHHFHKFFPRLAG